MHEHETIEGQKIWILLCQYLGNPQNRECFNESAGPDHPDPRESVNYVPRHKEKNINRNNLH